ncbi:MAG: hypothetical protein VKO21_09295 [Candidatus Sericytochromatia bacterium]|nr:hypothetical protein [Candidatus Sericytochromatia bacterium]
MSGVVSRKAKVGVLPTRTQEAVERLASDKDQPLLGTLGDTAVGLADTARALRDLQREAKVRAGGSVVLTQEPRGASQSGQRDVLGNVSRTTDVASSLAQLARSHESAIRDFNDLQRVMLDPYATTSMRVLASAKATQSAANFVNQQSRLLGSLSAADRAYLAASPVYGKLTQPARPLLQLLGRTNDTLAPLTRTVAFAGSVAGVGLGVVTLPGLVKGTVAAGGKMMEVLNNPASSRMDKADAVAETTRGAAGVIMAGNAIKSGLETIHDAMYGTAAAGGTVVRKGFVGHLAGGLGRVMKFLLPVADVGMFVADSVRMAKMMKDPAATSGDKVRQGFLLALGGLKLTLYLLPQSLFLRGAYIAASAGQVGLTAWSFARASWPKVKEAVAGLFGNPANRQLA